MAFFSDLTAHVDSLRALLGERVDAGILPGRVAGLGDEDLVRVIREASAVVRAAETVRIAAAGAAAARSGRERGHAGLAQVRGHRSPVSLVQEITGGTRSDAVRQIRLGEALLAGGEDGGPGGDGDDGGSPGGDDGDPGRGGAVQAWHAPLGAALLHGAISSAQHDAILRGLGEPPQLADAPGDDPDARWAVAAARDEARAAWSAAAVQLIEEARVRSVEELGASARMIRDVLDPAGAEARFDERYARRSFRLWTDADGVHHGSFLFDDEAFAWVRSIVDAALRPRRGVRFADPTEAARAQQVVDDPRTTDQLVHDLMIDVLRAGALADAAAVFGTRQAGIRLVITQDAADRVDRGEPAVGTLEEHAVPVPGWVVTAHACATGTTACTLDDDGNPLDLGREARLYSAKQKLVLALRDGGCRWPGCDRPAHYCEAHHIDHWSADGGKTDVDRGILLCRFHHMQLHHGGWRITRTGRGDFVLHPPGAAAPIVLTARLARRYTWAGAAPPSRFQPAARAG